MNPFGDDDEVEEDDVFDSDLSRYLEDVDRAIEARQDTPTHLSTSGDDEMDDGGISDVAEYLELFEKNPVTTHAKLLIDQKVYLPDPDSLDDEDLHMKLWQVIFGLENQRTYLYHTDHLSDRGLYKLLWNDLLNEQAYDLRKYPEAACHVDALPIEGDESQDIWLKYYADDQERDELKKESPEVTIPYREIPPHDRDRFLPKRP
ncbi:MAG: hypothetical protein AAGA58_11895 [Verrucomicrobiota bacterium]